MSKITELIEKYEKKFGAVSRLDIISDLKALKDSEGELLEALQDSTELLKYLLVVIPSGEVYDTVQKCIKINEQYESTKHKTMSYKSKTVYLIMDGEKPHYAYSSKREALLFLKEFPQYTLLEMLML